jgi:phage FluMu protein Com
MTDLVIEFQLEYKCPYCNYSFYAYLLGISLDEKGCIKHNINCPKCNKIVTSPIELRLELKVYD